MSVKSKAQSMSGAGLMVVVTMCLALLVVIGTVCWLAIQETETPEVLDRVLQGLLIGVPALLAKTYRDAQQDSTSGSDEVVPVQVQEPVLTREVTTDVGSTDVRGDPLMPGIDLDAPTNRRRRSET